MTEENNFELEEGQFLIEEFTNFVLIVDNEVAINYKLPVILATEKMIAVLKSNPIILETLEEIEEGSTWDGQNFIPPVEQYYD